MKKRYAVSLVYICMEQNIPCVKHRIHIVDAEDEEKAFDKAQASQVPYVSPWRVYKLKSKLAVEIK